MWIWQVGYPIENTVFYPLVYVENKDVVAKLRAFMPVVYSPAACMYHYLQMAERNYREYLQGESVWTKKYFYVLRPVLACAWIEAGRGVVPMEFERLVEAMLPAGTVRDEVAKLLSLKKAGAELEQGPKVEALNHYLDGEIARLSKCAKAGGGDVNTTSQLNSFFRETLAQVWA